MVTSRIVLVLLVSHLAHAIRRRDSAGAVSASNSAGESAAEVNANPIRKVVTMLQNMEKKVVAEGKKEEEVYKKFECYCKTGGGTLANSIAMAEPRIPKLQSDAEQAESETAQLKEDLKNHQADRKAAKAAMADATAIRKRDEAAFASEKAEFDTNLGSIKAAITALEKGMAGSFLQSTNAGVLRQLAVDKLEMLDADRQDLLAFLSSGQSAKYSPASGEITGILKQMSDEMTKNLESASADEAAALKSFDALMAAKKKEVDALTGSIETKTVRAGELAVSIVHLKDDLKDTEEGLAEDKKLLAEMDKTCATQAALWDERQKTRSEELLALADTIKILNDDDALELFKKTLPGSSSLLEFAVSTRKLKSKALMLLSKVRVDEADRPQMDFVTLVLRSKGHGLEKVAGMVKDMEVNLKHEQAADDEKKEYCSTHLSELGDKKKSIQNKISDQEIAISDHDEAIAEFKSDIASLEAGVKALDKSVAEATENRKEEHDAFIQLMAGDSSAKEILAFAKNRLNKFYNPSMYKAPPHAEESSSAAAFVQIAAGVRLPAPPATLGAYSKKSEESTGVIGMIDTLVKDLDKEMTEAKVEEEHAQADYEEIMKESASKRQQDTKTLTLKQEQLADAEAAKDSHIEGKTAAERDLMATDKLITTLHAECDFLTKYFEQRKDARTNEIEALEEDQAILKGSDEKAL